MDSRLLRVGERYNGYNGNGDPSDDVIFAHDILPESMRGEVIEGIVATGSAIDELYALSSDSEYPRFQPLSFSANEELKTRLPGIDLAKLCGSELSPQWVLSKINEHPEEVVAVASILSAARCLAGRFLQIAHDVDNEVD